MDLENIIANSPTVLTIVDMFDSLNGLMQLELIGLLLEKMENDEIKINGKPVTPEDVGIDDAFACCATIQDMAYRI